MFFTTHLMVISYIYILHYLIFPPIKLILFWKNNLVYLILYSLSKSNNIFNIHLFIYNYLLLIIIPIEGILLLYYVLIIIHFYFLF